MGTFRDTAHHCTPHALQQAGALHTAHPLRGVVQLCTGRPRQRDANDANAQPALALPERPESTAAPLPRGQRVTP